LFGILREENVRSTVDRIVSDALCLFERHTREEHSGLVTAKSISRVRRDGPSRYLKDAPKNVVGSRV